jgi:hypothetical protein
MGLPISGTISLMFNGFSFADFWLNLSNVLGGEMELFSGQLVPEIIFSQPNGSCPI